MNNSWTVPAAPTVLWNPSGAHPSAASVPSTLSFTSLVSAADKVLDFVSVFTAVYVATALQSALEPMKRASYEPSRVFLSAAGFALLFVFLMERHGAYRGWVSLLAIRETERVLRVTLQSFSVALLAGYSCGAHLSRLTFVLALGMVPAFVTLEKWEARNIGSILRSKGYGTRRAVILGSGVTARHIYSALLRSPNLGVEPVAFVDDSSPSAPAEVYESAYKRERSAKVLSEPLSPDLFRRLNASVLMIATSEAEAATARLIAAQASAAGLDTYFVPGDSAQPGFWFDYAELDGTMLAHVCRARGRMLYDVGKRTLDLVTAAMFLILGSPLFAAIAALVKAGAPGSVFFRQERVGLNGRLFTMYKFRTMYREVPNYGFSPTAGEDPRVTTIGRFLRRSSLDELPQLINVLLGQMSLVGPRPEMPFIVATYTAGQRQRLSVKPGITCLWQLSADRAFLIHENMEYDLYYVRYRSLFMDAAILLHTLLFAARGV